MTVVIGAQAKDIVPAFLDKQNRKTPLIEDLSILSTVPTVALVRPECENQTQFIHFVTYAILRDKASKDIFIYQRGGKGGETKLHDAFSIGVGGHVEKNGGGNLSLIELFERTFRQELQEEVSLTLNNAQQTNLLAGLKNTGKNTVLIFDDSNPVGKVHVGVASVIDVDKEQIGALEEGTLVNAEWKPSSLIMQDHHSGSRVLENWSLFMALFVDSLNLSEHMRRFEVRKKA